MSVAAESAALAAFDPRPEVVTLSGGRVVEVWPLRLGQVGRFAAAVGPVLPYLSQLGGTLLAAEAEGERLAEVIAIGAGLDADAIAALRIDEVDALLAALMRANAGFFALKLGMLETPAETAETRGPAAETPGAS